MLYLILADLLVILHLAFVAFVVLGGLFVFRWRRAAWVHLPAALWGFLIELFGWICPLTPLEVRLRRLGGEAGYSGGFVEHYLLPVLYPQGLTRTHQIILGTLVVAVNGGVYGWWLLRRRRQRLASRARPEDRNQVNGPGGA
jgi:hypothetical protein